MKVVGLLSGTSVDGLDVAVAGLTLAGHRRPRHGGELVTSLGQTVFHHVEAGRALGTLLGRWLHLLGAATVSTSDTLGLPADAKEAYLVALLGWFTWHTWFTWHGVPGVVPGGTGSPVARVLGRISPGAAPLRLPEPVDQLDRSVVAT